MNHFSSFLTGSALLLVAITGNAQTKIKDGSVSGTSSLAKPGAILDLESNKRALLLPRVELTSTRNWTPLDGLAPTEGGYTVYNTSLTTEGDEFYPVLSEGAGEYYWDGQGWLAKKAVYLEPFLVANSLEQATYNTQNIYQNGNLGLGNFGASVPMAKLDVRGAVRGGGLAWEWPGPIVSFPDQAPAPGTIGVNSAAFGYGNNGSGPVSFAAGLVSEARGYVSIAMGMEAKALTDLSIAMGNNTTASGQSAIAIGVYNVASGETSTAMGVRTLSTGTTSTTFGYGSKAAGYYSTAMGYATTASAFNETVIGEHNAITNGDPVTPIPTDGLFQIGNGNGDYLKSFTASNALTVLRNGKTKIGSHATKPNLTLEISGTDGVLLPTGDTSQRPATAVFGTLRYNTSIGRAEVYVNDANGDGTQGDAGWKPL